MIGYQKLAAWLSGCWAGIFIGALVACPAKIISLPLSAVAVVVFGWLAKVM